MPWHDNSENGKPVSHNNSNGGGQGPWGQPPRNGSGNNNGSGRPNRPVRGGGEGDPPDLEELLEASRARLKRAFPGRGGRGGGSGGGGEFKLTGPMMGVGLLIAGILYIFAGVYQVGASQQAVRTTFGKFDGISGPGLKWHAPLFQNIELVDVRNQQTSYVGYIGEATDRPTENLMLTSDRNIVDISFTVNWRIRQGAVPAGELPNAAKFVFNIEDPKGTVTAVAEAAMRETVGGQELDPIITSGQLAVNEQTRERIQQVLDDYGSGIQVERVNIERPEPPAAVRDAFADVVRAGNEKNQMINEATRDANQIVPVAQGQALKIEQEAKAYAAQTEAEAIGQAGRFTKILEEYLKAKQVTRQRMYLETTERVLAKMNKIVIDEQAGNGIVPYLPLNELQRAGGN